MTATAPVTAVAGNGKPARDRAAKKRLLVIVNPFASTVSDRLKNLVVYALQSRYEVEAVMTEAKDHATEIGREACDGGYDLVVSFGGDGTLNEVVNGVAGTGVAVFALPGGRVNVACRTLGIPADVVDATEHLLGLADELRSRPIDLGIANGRHFVFACGAGIDASVVRRVDANPKLKARGGDWYYTYAALADFNRRYLLGSAPVLRLETAQGTTEGITAIAQNSDPFTYFGSRPIRICEDVAIDDGTIAIAMLKRAALRDVPAVMARALSTRFPASRYSQIAHFPGLTEARIEAVGDGAGPQPQFPVQVDGDYIGEHAALELEVDAGALQIVA